MFLKRQLLFGMCFLCLCCSTGDDTAIAPQDPLEERLQEAKTLEKPQWDSVYRQLFQEATRTEVDSVRLQRLSSLSVKFIRRADSALFRQVNTQAMAEAERQKDTTAQAEACWDLAVFLRDNSIPDSAFYHYSKAQRLYQNLGEDFYSGRMYLNMAIVQTDIKDYTGSEITTFRAIRLLQPLEKHKELYRCYNNLAIGAKFLGEYDRALSYYQTALEHVQQIEEDNSILRLGTLNNIGTVYKEMEDHQAALPYFEEVLQTPNLQIEKPDLYARALTNYAFNRFKAGQDQDVEADLQKALALRIELGEQSDIADSYNKLTEYHFESGNDDKALENGQKAIFAAKSVNSNETLLRTLNLLSTIDNPNTSVYGREYIRINDSLQAEERKIRDKFARIRFETDEVIAENEALARERQFLTLLSLAAFFLAMAGFIIFRQRIKNQRLRFEQEQQAHNTEIFNLMLQQNQKFEEGKKEEQKRISEELHDGVLGKMLGARMVLTGLNKKQDKGAIAERAGAIESLRAVEVEVRSLSHELSHAAYEKIHNFIASIRELLDNLSHSSGLALPFDFDGTFDWDALDGDLKINVYRIVQEAVQNAIKHAQCTEVRIQFAHTNGQIEIGIVDDGKGFVPKKNKGGIGMRNITSRMERMDGHWQIHSAPGKGTRLEFTIPIKYYAKKEEFPTNS